MAVTGKRIRVFGESCSVIAVKTMSAVSGEEGNVFWKGGFHSGMLYGDCWARQKRPEFQRIWLHPISQIGIGDRKEDGCPVVDEYGVGGGEA